MLFDKGRRSNTRTIVFYNCFVADCWVVGTINASINPLTGGRYPMVFNRTAMVSVLA